MLVVADEQDRLYSSFVVLYITSTLPIYLPYTLHRVCESSWVDVLLAERRYVVVAARRDTGCHQERTAPTKIQRSSSVVHSVTSQILVESAHALHPTLRSFRA
jgi:hypothetical protein